MSAGFSFGGSSNNTSQPSGSSSSFGPNNTSQPSQPTSFGFGSGNTAQTPGFGFGASNASQPATSQSQDNASTRPTWSINTPVTSDPFKPASTGSGLFGSTPATTGTATFGFGQAKPTNTSLNVPSQPQPFSFPQSTTQQQPSIGFTGLGKGPTTASTTASNQTTSFSAFGGFGVGSTSASTFNATSSFVGFNAGKTQVTTAPTAPITTASTGFTLGSGKTEASSGFSLFVGTKTQPTFGFGGAQTTTASNSLGFGTAQPTTTSSSFTLGSSQPSQDTSKKESIGFGANATSKPSFGGLGLGLGVAPKTTQGQSTSSGLFSGIGDVPKTSSGISPFGTTTTTASGFNFPKQSVSSASSTQPNLFSSAASATPTGLFSKKDTTATTTGAPLLPSTPSTAKPLPTFTKSQLQQPAPITSSAPGSSATISTTTQASTSSTSLSFSAPSLLQPKTSSITQAKPSVPIITAPLSTPTTTSAASIIKPALSSIPVTTATTSAPDQIPSWLKNNNIEGIIKKWTTDLDNCTKKFHNQVREVNQWDQKIIENNGRVTRLGEQINKADSLQEEINICLNNVEARQQELEKILSEYEEKFGDPSLEAMNPLDKEREKTYELAESINQELDNMSQVLSAMITDMNRSTTSSTLTSAQPEDEDEVVMNELGEDPIDEVVKILNAHLTSLQWIDATANQLSARVQEAQSFLDDR
ncbi:Nsp1-like C-terminal region-domain-containing protein [Gigaspora rosea]|uniref:Nsp1-like C-terminal region-domain-containing protein n=1 Tax=Gigaspora rosea TaxID=44941 RepID=A0A397V6M0_9GLOM|nr:Nsp1-like C-terminal region-domain-containing protein [Gigaspora rosea]